MIELLIQNHKGVVLNASDITSSITYTTYLEDNPSKLDVTLKHTEFDFKEGSVVMLKINSQNIFLGYVFKRKISKEDTMSITCYDSMRYLQNKDTKVFVATTLPNIFSSLCTELGMKYKVINSSNYNCPAVIHDNKSYYEMIKRAIDETLIGTTEWFFIRDNFGVIELCAVSQQMTNLFIGDESLLTDFTYQTDIDSDTFNQIKLTQENQDTKKREVYIVRDTNTIKSWGLLQYYESVDEEMTATQIKDRAEMLLKVKNKVTKSLKLSCVGDLRLKAGNGVVLGINKLKNEDVQQNQYAFIEECRHSWSGGKHMMDLTVRVVN